MNIPQKQRGITLIEVLISIAIIGFLLGAILIVVRPMMVRKAYDTEAIAGLRGWYNAYTMYRTDNDDKEPRNFWHFLSYNPGAEWDVPKTKQNPDCIGKGFFYGRAHPVPIIEQRPNILNPYDPQKEPVIHAYYRCRQPEGDLEFLIWRPDLNKVITERTKNRPAPGILQGGNIKWRPVVSAFDFEMAMIFTFEGFPRGQ
ncbi:MAG TPA: type II secretion system protein [Fimbriimonadaceae bacterium]|nr:type II secretion system protein [Fimbriimonadaceae bacterium]HRJ34164.1 type II secretion system protein [Fimbriimonadaceae bacterium]